MASTGLIFNSFIIVLHIFFLPVTKPQVDSPVVLVIHGGAGQISKENVPDSIALMYQIKMEEALIQGYDILEKGGSSIDAIKVVINILEDSPLFNAGKGAVFTNEGTIEMDASIMDGANQNAGAVAGVTTIRNPINAAIEVMNESPHVLLAGRGAEQFARERGLVIVDPDYFYTGKQYRKYKELKNAEGLDEEEGKGRNDFLNFNEHKYGTVGAIALDRTGNLAAGTSTGGMSNKRYGRVGDSPIIGAGTYADNQSCAVSATGHGEFFIRGVIAYDIAARIKYQGLNVKQAASALIYKKLPEMGGTGGVIVLDRHGNIAMEFNTKGMFRGYINKQGAPVVYMFAEN